MKCSRAKKPRDSKHEMSKTFTNFVTIILFLLFMSAFYLVMCFKPMSKQDQLEKMEKLNSEVEPFRKNLTECAFQVKASNAEVEDFLKRIPQSTFQGKCFVACILKRNHIITNNKVNEENLLMINRGVYGDDNDMMDKLKAAVKECKNVVENIFEICEYASVFNDCMHMRMEHILDKLTMERRMQALGQMSEDPDEWVDEDDEMLQLVKDEL